MRLLVASALLFLSACTVTPDDHVWSLILRLDLDDVAVESSETRPGSPVPLGTQGPIEIIVTDAASGEELARGRTLDTRWAIGEPEADGQPGDALGMQIEGGALVPLALPRPASGRARVRVALADSSGAPIERTLDLDVEDVASSAAPLRAPLTTGDVSRATASLEECPTQARYGDWPELPDPPVPNEPRSAHWGCGRMEHVGGNVDPSGRALVVIYPSQGDLGQWPSLMDFKAAAEGAIGAMLERNDFFRRNQSHFSFYALMDETARQNAAFGCSGTVAGQTHTINDGTGGYWYWRTRGAAYGPVPRFEVDPDRPIGPQVDGMRRPDYHIGLLNGSCSGWGMAPGSVVLVGTRFNAYAGLPAGLVEWDDSNVVFPVGDRIAHELGHAIGGLADEYGWANGEPSSRACPGYSTNETTGDPWPNIARRTPANNDPPSEVQWACLIGRGIECPDHQISDHSYVREAGAPGCAVTPCTDSLMRGFAALSPQFDAWADIVMARELDAKVAGTPRALYSETPCGSGVCAGDCNAVMCARDGCGGSCETNCTCDPAVECLNALGVAVCSGRRSCARTLDIRGGALQGACPGAPRTDDTYILTTCSDESRIWTAPTDCTTYDTVDACFAAGLAMP